MGTLSPWAETLSSNKKRVIQELVHGQECATQLQILFHKPCEQDGRLSSAEELVQKILRSFDDTLSVLSSVDSAEVVSQNQPTCNDDSPCCDDRRSEDSSESRKRPASKDKRGCYKRKKSAQTWTAVSATMDDGHAWRKYGQKEILNSKQPRDSYKAPQILMDSEAWKSYNMVTSEYSQIPSKRQNRHHHLNPSITPTVKQECKEETTPSDLTDLDSMIIWKDIMSGDGFEYTSEPGIGSDYKDVVSNMYPCTEITSRNFEYDDLGIKPIDDQFGNDFHFDESECLV
ncbi:hypothetical protein REPUB_Repub13aG0116800 [Reevesia pubescens]